MKSRHVQLSMPGTQIEAFYDKIDICENFPITLGQADSYIGRVWNLDDLNQATDNRLVVLDMSGV
jgi:hypothetical protein